jgi:CBS domain-containing membrane protein
MKLRDVMRTQVPTATRGEMAAEVWDRMCASDADHVVVVEGDEVVGVLSWQDLSGPAGGSRRRMGRRVGDMMREDVVTAGPATTVKKAAATMRKARVGCLPVLEHRKLVGLVGIREMLGILAGELPGPARKRRRAKPVARR